MRLIWDARGHTMYPIGKEGFTSGTVQMIREISKGLAERGHTVHVLTPDLEREEQRGPTLWYWGPGNFPWSADVAVMTMHVDGETPLEADVLVLATFGTDPNLGPEHQWASAVDGFPIFSRVHGNLMREMRPTIPEEKLFLTGLGVDLANYEHSDCWDCCIGQPCGKEKEAECVSELKVPGRLLYANDPQRGLWPLLDIFDHVRKEVPDASLHVAYDFERNLALHAWEHSLMAETLWECKRRMETTPGITVLSSLDRAGIVREELECQVHAMPSDPPNVGTQIHGITQLECAAAGAALVLSDVEAFPEVFEEGATILPVVGKYLEEHERRYDAQDWAAVVVELMQDKGKWAEASRKARALAEQHTWSNCVDRWEEMLNTLWGRRNVN